MKKYRTEFQDGLSLEGMDVAIGFFDGFHKGHMRILQEILPSKRSTLLTFSTNLSSLSKDSTLILTEDEKETVCERTGINNYIVLEFNTYLKDRTKEEFISFIRKANPNSLFFGEDFTFGRMGEGKADDLLQFNFSHKIPLFEIGGVKVSSSRIKKLISEGKIEEANSLMYYPYFIKGEVIHGLRNGRKLSFPTANMKEKDNKIKLPEGVYLTRTRIERRTYTSMTNIGSHPTIDKLNERIVETHIIDFNKEIYGKIIEVEFLHFLRPQIRFENVEKLEEQLSKDRNTCLELIKNI